MRVRVDIARSQREYAEVIVDAPSIEIAEAYVAALLADTTGHYEKAYYDAINRVHWNGGDEAFDEDVIDAVEGEDDDEAEVTVPEGWTPAPELTAPELKTYTVMVFYMDNHEVLMQHVQAETPLNAQMNFVDPRGDTVAYDHIAVIEGTPAVFGPRPSPTGDELRKAHEHAKSCDGELQRPALDDSRLWICDECSTAIEWPE